MTDTFQPGDKVQRINSTWIGSLGAVIEGEVYTVKDQKYRGGALELEEVKGNYSPCNFVLVEIPTPSAIDAALKILRLAGEVTFKPTKPSFTPIKVKVGEFEGVVTEAGLRVGCTTIPFDKAEEIWKAVQKAKEYNAQA
jgi:hypothetical protein